MAAAMLLISRSAGVLANHRIGFAKEDAHDFFGSDPIESEAMATPMSVDNCLACRDS
jgi:hypothetical protein